MAQHERVTNVAEEKSSGESTWRPRVVPVVLTALALLIPWWAITQPGLVQFQAWPAAASPFGLNRILVVHLVAALPFSFWVAWRLPLKGGQLFQLLCVCVGLLLAWGSLKSSGWIAQTVGESAGSANFFWRTLWVLIVQLPWVVATVDFLKTKMGIDRPFWTDGITAALLLVVPFVYVGFVVERQEVLLNEELANQQYVTALGLVEKLAVIGDDKSRHEMFVGLKADLLRTVVELQERVQQPLPENATREQRLAAAIDFFRLGDFESMKKLIGSQANVDPMASYRMALSFEAQRNWEAAIKQLKSTIRLIEASGDPAWEPVLRSAIEHLANNLRRNGDYAEAENMLLGGLENQQLQDTYLLQLGFHYKMAGRTNEAVDYFQKAADANEAMQPFVQRELGSIDQQPEGCLLRITPGATR